jgi:hypothetical protein
MQLVLIYDPQNGAFYTYVNITYITVYVSESITHVPNVCMYMWLNWKLLHPLCSCSGYDHKNSTDRTREHSITNLTVVSVL